MYPIEDAKDAFFLFPLGFFFITERLEASGKVTKSLINKVSNCLSESV